MMVLAIYESPVEREKQLTQLGVAEKHLHMAARRGLLAWANSSPLHPVMVPSFLAWADTVAGLRAGLAAEGWKSVDEEGLALVVSPSNLVAIGVATGNEFTGRSTGIPATKSGKGPKTSELVMLNQLQASLFPTDEFLSERLMEIKNRAMWILLIHRDTSHRELRCELSRPITINSTDGRIVDWQERIILPPTQFDDDMVITPYDVDADDLNIEITLK